MNYLTSVYWERGMAAVDQDSVVLLQTLTARGRVLMAAVCDGMGGPAYGERVSGYVTQRLQEWFYESLLRAIRKKKPYWVVRRSMDRLVFHMQEQIALHGAKAGVSAGTAMTVTVMREKTYLLWHLGDSRAYRIRIGTKGAPGKRIERLTADHVSRKGKLTKCVGSFGFARPDFRLGTLCDGQGLLLCSDGFYRAVDEAELADVLGAGRLKEEEQAARRLREIGGACIRRGERDDLSAVYIQVRR